MKKFYCFISLLLLQSISYSQVNRSLSPLSFSLPENFLPEPAETDLPEFDLAKAERLDKEDTKNSNVPKISRSLYTNITLDNSGNWSELPNGDRVWRVSLRSAGAQGLLPYFDQFYLPPGSFLHVYNAAKTEVIGAFTSANNPPDGYYCTGLIHGESCIFEYYEPKQVRGQGMIHLNEVGHAYRAVNDYFPFKSGPQDTLLGFGYSVGCEVNVNCSEGAAWQDQKRSVACFIIQGQDGNQYICSGALINNTAQDGTPYFLTADHCGVLSLPYQYGQWVFYFNYESPNCSSPTSLNGLTNDFITGCVKIADSDDGGFSTGSDFLLLKLRQQIPSSFNAYFSGWDRNNAPAASGVGIHHPKGDIKKISTFSVPDTSISFTGQNPGTHWTVHWAATANGHGVTEKGSSGSALYNEQGLVVGHLTAGYSACGQDTDEADYYGKFAYDWISNGNQDTVQLKPWLDPQNTGSASLEGIDVSLVSGISGPVAGSFFLRISPNPSPGVFQLDFDDHSPKTIQVIDALGRSVYETTTSLQHLPINLAQQSKGVYILTSESINERITQKLVLE